MTGTPMLALTTQDTLRDRIGEHMNARGLARVASALQRHLQCTAVSHRQGTDREGSWSVGSRRRI